MDVFILRDKTLNVEVRKIEGKGNGLVALRNVVEGDFLFSEHHFIWAREKYEEDNMGGIASSSRLVTEKTCSGKA